MIGSFSQVQRASNTTVSRRPLLRSQTEQSLKGGHGLVAPIVAKNKLIEVDLELPAAHTVVGTDQPLLEVADSTVGQGHYRFGSLAQFGCLRLLPRDVPIPGFVQTRETLQRIGVDRRAWSDMLLDKATERGCLKVWDHSHPHSPRRLTALLNGHQDKSGSPPLELTTSAQTRLGTTNPGLINLYLSTQRRACRVNHSSAPRVEHTPGRFVTAQFQRTLEQKRRNPTFIGRHQVRRPKPQQQRYSGIVENSPRCQRYLMPARCALPESRHDVRTQVPAPRTFKSVRPTTDGQILLTGLFASELSLEFAQTMWKRRPRHILTLYVVFC